MSSSLRSTDKQLLREEEQPLGDDEQSLGEDESPLGDGDSQIGEAASPLGAEAETLLETDRDTLGSDATDDAEVGFRFDTETEHHDPVMQLMSAYEKGNLNAGFLEAADTAALKRFVVRAETGEFDVRSNPALEVAVRIARSLIYERCRDQ